jgi:hypothetical protein
MNDTARAIDKLIAFMNANVLLCFQKLDADFK